MGWNWKARSFMLMTVKNINILRQWMHLVCESLSQQRERICDKVELIWGNALAAVCSNGQCISLSIDAEEFQVQETVSESTLLRMIIAKISGVTWQLTVIRERVKWNFTACKMALLCRLDNISNAVRACSATSMNWMTWSCVKEIVQSISKQKGNCLDLGSNSSFVSPSPRRQE